MMIDTILRNSVLADKMVEHEVKTKQLTPEQALKELEEMTPLGSRLFQNAKPKPKPAGSSTWTSGTRSRTRDTIWSKARSNLMLTLNQNSKLSRLFTAPSSHKIKVFGHRKGNEILGMLGEFVSVDYDICVGDGACIDACPVKVYEWAEFAGNPASEKKPLMTSESLIAYFV